MAALDVRRVMQLLAPVLSTEDGVALRLTRTDSPCDARILCETAKRPGEAFHSLWQERFIVAIPEGHPLGLKPEILVPDLATVPLVAREYCSNELFEGARRLGLKLEVAASALSEDWALALVEAGVGIAILPESYVKPQHRIVVRQFANLEVHRSVGIAYDPLLLQREPGEGLRRLLAAVNGGQTPSVSGKRSKAD